MALIELTGISRHYGEGEALVKALDGVDLTIEQGSLVALLGPSGSGKTTLLNTVAALDTPTSGSYMFDGAEVPLSKVEPMTTFRRENVGYIFQFFNLLADLTALENILLVQQLAGNKDKARAEHLLKAVGLEGLENRFPAQMSGGQRQRVAIARALAKTPRLLLGDELTGNLDTKTSKQVMEVLIDICRKENVTLIFVTHDSKLTNYADRIISLDSGKIVSDEVGPLKQVIGQSKDHARRVVQDAKSEVLKVKNKVAGKISETVKTIQDLKG